MLAKLFHQWVAGGPQEINDLSFSFGNLRVNFTKDQLSRTKQIEIR